ncbi:MAG: PQQ-like beta-propeller repeat protein, partial [Armatimonadota bacterium]|nr:PQQ-like beta-propeller repeat protein [Armatimonadota bacterium]
MKIKTFNQWTGFVLTALLCAPALAADWPEFRGPEHDGRSPETILKAWPDEGPKVAWRNPIGAGFAAFSVSQGKAYCFVERNGKEAVVAWDAKTGKELWASTIDDSIRDRQGGDGPRSTPAVDGDRVYILSTYLWLVCLNAADGKELWAHDLVREFGGREIPWGNAASPIIDGDLIFAC